MTLPIYTAAQAAAQLTSGYWGGASHFWHLDATRTVTYSLASTTSSAQKAMIEAAFDAWSQVANIHFKQVDTGGQIKFDNTGGGANTFAVYSDTAMKSATVSISAMWTSIYGSTVGSYGYQTYLHEIGHALGLGHAGNYNGSANYATDALYANDSWQTSVMSYIAQDRNTSISASYAFVLTPMVFDIVAIRQLYGAATAHAGDTVYGLNSTAGGALDYLANIGQSGFNPGVAFTLIDSSGTDVVDFSASGLANRISLVSGAVSDVLGKIGNMAIAAGTVIENLRTGSGADRITGNAVANAISSGAGNDTIDGGAGNDSLSGGIGNDILYGGAGNDRISDTGGKERIFLGLGNDRYTATGDLAGAGDSIWGGDGNDTVSAGAGNDVITGEAGSDWLSGGTGVDRLNGGAGNDILIGGAGRDTFVFAATDGMDHIRDFAAGVDRIDLSALDLAGWSDLTSHMKQTGTSVTIDFAAMDIVLDNVSLSAVKPTDFIL